MTRLTGFLPPEGPAETLRRLPGVVSAHLHIGPDGTVEHLYLVARRERTVGRILREVAAALRGGFGLELNEDNVRLVLLSGDERAWSGGRFVLERITQRNENQKTHLAVHIRDGRQVVTGWASCETGRLRRKSLAALAVLDAAGGLIGEKSLLELAGCEIIRLAGRDVAAVSLAFADPSGDRHFHGLAEVGGSDDEAIARATLDALNRRLRVVRHRRQRRRISL